MIWAKYKALQDELDRAYAKIAECRALMWKVVHGRRAEDPDVYMYGNAEDSLKVLVERDEYKRKEAIDRARTIAIVDERLKEQEIHKRVFEAMHKSDK